MAFLYFRQLYPATPIWLPQPLDDTKSEVFAQRRVKWYHISTASIRHSRPCTRGKRAPLPRVGRTLLITLITCILDRNSGAGEVCLLRGREKRRESLTQASISKNRKHELSKAWYGLVACLIIPRRKTMISTSYVKSTKHVTRSTVKQLFSPAMPRGVSAGKQCKSISFCILCCSTLYCILSLCAAIKGSMLPLPKCSESVWYATCMSDIERSWQPCQQQGIH